MKLLASCSISAVSSRRRHSGKSSECLDDQILLPLVSHEVGGGERQPLPPIRPSVWRDPHPSRA